MQKKILALIMIQVLFVGVLLVIPHVNAGYLDIVEAKTPSVVRQDSPVNIELAIVNNEYEDKDCYVRVYLRDAKHLAICDEQDNPIVFYQSEIFTIPARTKLTGIQRTFQIPTTISPGKYYFEIEVFNPDTNWFEDYSYDNAFTLLEPLEPFPYWIYAICILPIILIIAGLYLKHKIGRKPQH